MRREGGEKGRRRGRGEREDEEGGRGEREDEEGGRRGERKGGSRGIC